MGKSIFYSILEKIQLSDLQGQYESNLKEECEIPSGSPERTAKVGQQCQWPITSGMGGHQGPNWWAHGNAKQTATRIVYPHVSEASRMAVDDGRDGRAVNWAKDGDDIPGSADAAAGPVRALAAQPVSYCFMCTLIIEYIYAPAQLYSIWNIITPLALPSITLPTTSSTPNPSSSSQLSKSSLSLTEICAVLSANRWQGIAAPSKTNTTA